MKFTYYLLVVDGDTMSTYNRNRPRPHACYGMHWLYRWRSRDKRTNSTLSFRDDGLH